MSGTFFVFVFNLRFFVFNLPIAVFQGCVSKRHAPPQRFSPEEGRIFETKFFYRGRLKFLFRRVDVFHIIDECLITKPDTARGGIVAREIPVAGVVGDGSVQPLD